MSLGIYSLHILTSEAVVGMEKTIYSVSKNVGFVEVCAILYSPTIDCPITFPFDVSLSTSDRTAGWFVECSLNVIGFLYICLKITVYAQ